MNFPISLDQWLESQTTDVLSAYATATVDPAFLPQVYLQAIMSTQRLHTALRLCIMCYHTTLRTHCPRPIQLDTALSLLAGKDTFLYAGTGTGKTLASILPAYVMDRNGLIIMIVPMKRIQASHARAIREKFGLKVVVVNEETPRDKEFWQRHVHDAARKTPGDVQVIITTPEQLRKTAEGRYSKLGELIRDSFFRSRIRFMVVDEAHCIHTTGFARYGEKAFRIAYGHLDDIKALLGSHVPWLALTATAPPFMLKTIAHSVLRPSYVTIQVSLNRPNLTYACHQVVGSLDRLDNYLCFLTQPFDLKLQPRVLIFVENMNRTVEIASFLNSKVPESHRHLKIVRHQHSDMSPQYQAHTHAAFVAEGGTCRILVSTSTEGTGVDHPDVDVTCVSGDRSSAAELAQSGGRTMRREDKTGFVIFFYESWVEDIDITKYPGDVEDLDRPGVLNLTGKTTAKERTSRSYAAFVQSTSCRRRFFAEYLGDETAEALVYTGDHCCDNCHDFALENYLPSAPFVEPPPPPPTTKRPRELPGSARPPVSVQFLKMALEISLSEWHEQDDLQLVRAPEYILRAQDITLLSKTRVGTIVTASDVSTLLRRDREWEAEWGIQVLEMVECADEAIRKEWEEKENEERVNNPKKRKVLSAETIEDSDVDDDTMAAFLNEEAAKRSALATRNLQQASRTVNWVTYVDS